MDYAGTHTCLTSGPSIFRQGLSRLARLLALALLLGVTAVSAPGCKRKPPPSPTRSTLELGVAFAGCEAVRIDDRGPVCELGESRSIRLVVAKIVTDVTIHAARHGEDPSAEVRLREVAREDPQRTVRSVEVPVGLERVIVRGKTAAGIKSFELVIAASRRVPWVLEAKGLRSKGELAKARAVASAHTSDPDPADRAAAKDLLARIALGEGHAEDAFPLFREAIAAHRAARRVSDEIDDSFALAFALHQRSHRYDEARSVLDAIAKSLPSYPEGRAREPYYRGILASETGDPRRALGLLRNAEIEAFYLDMKKLHRNALAALALELLAIGDAAESVKILTTLAKDPEVKGCERVELANDLAWAMLLENDSRLTKAESPRPFLEAALADASCSDAYVRSFALGNLAREALNAGELTTAEKHLAAARAAVTEPRGTERLAWLEIEARLLLSKKEPAKALARFEEARSLARAGLLLEAEWSALIGRGEALEALGKRAEAAAAYLAAEDVLDRTTLLVPLGEGRGKYVAERSRSARAAVDLFVAIGKNEDAARVARRSRVRVIETIDYVVRVGTLDAAARVRWEAALRTYRSAREAIDSEAAGDWRLPGDGLARATESRKQRETELRVALESAMSVITGAARSGTDARAAEPIAPQDLELVVHPGKKDWYAFAADATTTTAHKLDARYDAPDVLAPSLFGPITARIKAARRVRVRAYGRWTTVDVHSLPFEGAPLLEQVAVDYPVGLRRAEDAGHFDRRALVVGDPHDDLAAARREASAVAKALDGVMPHSLLLGALATSQAVAAALPRAGLFHYAGHSKAFQGADGWQNQLSLAAGGRLTVGDLLSLAPAPRKAVLLGCNAATSTDGGELHLAHALIASGSEEVIAPVATVDDVVTARLADALYAEDIRKTTLDLATDGSLAQAYRLAWRRVHAEKPDVDLSSFRVLAR